MRLIAAIGAAIWLSLASVAGAHAPLMHVHPAPGSRLATAPRSVQLRFGEPVPASLAAIRARDSSGRRVDRGAVFHPPGRPDVLGVRLRPGLRGPVAVAWRVVSDDGHPEMGELRFGVGAGGPAAAPLPALRRTPEVTEGLLSAVRALHDLAVALALGVVLFMLFARPRDRYLPPQATRGAAEVSRSLWRRVDRLIGRAAYAGLGLALAGAWLEGANIAARGPFDLHSADDAVAALGSRAGCGWGIALGAWLWLLLSLGRPARLRLGVATVAGVDALALAPVLCGHAAGAMLPVAFVHVVAVAVWVGGLPALLATAAALNRAGLSAAATARLARGAAGAYGRLALPAAIAVVGTGVVQALARLGGPVDLVTTAYGRLLLVKLACVCGLLALGALNRSWLLPQLRPATAVAATRMLQRTVAAELAVAVAVFAATGVLTGAAPPS